MDHIPTQADIQAEPDPDRRAIMSAMVRLLNDRPLNPKVPIGSLSTKNLALEAKVHRPYLYDDKMYSDLRETFEFLRDRRHEPTSTELELQAKLDTAQTAIERLGTQVESLTAERDRLKQANNVSARIINAQEVNLAGQLEEKQRLSERLRKATAVSDELAAQRHKRPQ